MARVDPEGLDESEGERDARAGEGDDDAGTRGEFRQEHDHHHNLRESRESGFDEFHVQNEARTVVARQHHRKDVHADGEGEKRHEDANDH